MTILEFLSKTEPIWLPVLFLVEIGLMIWTIRLQRMEIEWAKREFEYDEAKDLEKKQRRTRTTRKTTKGVSGESVVEEQIDTIEPVEEKKNVDPQS